MSEIDGLSFDEWLDREKRQIESAERQTQRPAGGQSRRVQSQRPAPARPAVRVQPDAPRPAPERAPSGLWDKWKIPLIALTAVLLLGVMALAAGFAYASKVAKIETIYPNVSVNGVAVGGMTVDQAAALLGDAPDKYDNAAVTVKFSTGESVTVTAQQLGLEPVDGTAFAQAAYDYGRDGSLLANMKDYLSCRSDGMQMRVDLADAGGVDVNAIEALVAPVAQQVDEKLGATQAQIGENEITLVKDAGGQTVDVAAVCAMVQDAFEREDYADIEYDPIAQGMQQGQTVDRDAVLQQLYDAVYAEAADAMYDPVTGGITDSVTGVRFDMDQARQIWDAAAPGADVVIPLIKEEPALTSEKLGGMLFADVLAEKSTTLYGSIPARINNITLAAQAMNGTVLQPGQEFDYNACLGQRTAAKGYQEAGAFEGGKHVMSIGGGICQGSSTLYYCAVKANLAITERYCHQFVVTYLPRGMDATVSWGFPNFKFVNDRTFPIRIEAWVSDGNLNIRLMGTNVDGSYVDLTNETWEDDTHYYAQTYRNVYDANGNLISSTKEAYSSYDKEEAVQATPEPTQAPVQEPVQEQDVYVPPAVTEPEYTEPEYTEPEDDTQGDIQTETDTEMQAPPEAPPADAA